MKLTERQQFIRDGIIFGISVIVAILMLQTRIVEYILTDSQFFNDLSSFIAGIFFTSIFTSAPATVALAEIAKTNSIFVVAFFGGLGSLLGDLFLFKFIRHHVTRDIKYILSLIKLEERWLQRAHHLHELKIFKFLLTFLGAIIIASPLPDELGLMIWGLSHTKTRTVVILSFILNFIGIALIGFFGQEFL
jgi:membrane protein DedA with SNARE-associated domain